MITLGPHVNYYQEELLADMNLRSDEPSDSDPEPEYTPKATTQDTFEGESELQDNILTLEVCYWAMLDNGRGGFIGCRSGCEPVALPPGAPNPI